MDYLKTQYLKIAKIAWSVAAFVLVFSLASLVNGGGITESVTIVLSNPLATTNIYTFIQSILGIVFRIGTVVAVFFIIYSGFLFITAQGNETKIATARKAFLWTVVGTAILLGSWLLATAIQGTIEQLRIT